MHGASCGLRPRPHLWVVGGDVGEDRGVCLYFYSSPAGLPCVAFAGDVEEPAFAVQVEWRFSGLVVGCFFSAYLGGGIPGFGCFIICWMQGCCIRPMPWTGGVPKGGVRWIILQEEDGGGGDGFSFASVAAAADRGGPCAWGACREGLWWTNQVSGGGIRWAAVRRRR